MQPGVFVQRTTHDLNAVSHIRQVELLVLRVGAIVARANRQHADRLVRVGGEIQCHRNAATFSHHVWHLIRDSFPGCDGGCVSDVVELSKPGRRAVNALDVEVIRRLQLRELFF